MIALVETPAFARWLVGLKDANARARVGRRLDRLRLGNAGDVKPVGEGVSELRIDYGPGYRVYYMQRGQTVIVLLAGGDKRSQRRDIISAIELARKIRTLAWPN